MLIHRCFIIWNRRKAVLYPLTFLSIIINGLVLGSVIATIVGDTDPGPSTSQSLVHIAETVNFDSGIALAIFNLLLTLMTAGRIWRITSSARTHGGSSISVRRCKTIMGIIIESGILFPFTLLMSIIAQLVWVTKTSGLPIDPTVLSTQLAGLAPTLIIVRVARAGTRSVDSDRAGTDTGGLQFQMVSTLIYPDSDPEPNPNQESNVEQTPEKAV
ncbi:hypothetical protein V5O48_016864 [Marasmius crinis-equi]|uniref:Uncharacterized protein n=1 Tax=Marasmius crinis-equi TaxID=585013 RepID=A0ABR3EQJ2_9AGAR